MTRLLGGVRAVDLGVEKETWQDQIINSILLTIPDLPDDATYHSHRATMTARSTIGTNRSIVKFKVSTS
jgi:hypothetical protein